MQLLNKLQDRWGEKTKLYLLIVAISLPVIVSIFILVFTDLGRQKSNPDEYFDPGSGETVSSPKDKTPELFGISSDGPTYLGFSKLIDAGLTTDQLDLVKVIFGRFSVTNDRNITEISITAKTIDLESSEEGFSMSFEITANRTTKYSSVIKYVGLNDAHVLVTDKDGQQVFDSSVE